jgi:hypothetical protein
MIHETQYDSGLAIALDALGNIYVAGSADLAFLKRNPLQVTNGGSRDGFVAKLSQPSMPPLFLLLGD